MAIVQSSVNDGEGRYASRTRVNRLVYDFVQADLAAQTAVTSSAIPLNGEIHSIWLDATQSKLVLNTDTQTAQGLFQIQSADILDLAGNALIYASPIYGVDYTTLSPAPYQFQTNEGAAHENTPNTLMNCSLAVAVGRSGHSTPATPMIMNTVGAPAVIDGLQPWTGRVCGQLQIKLTTVSAWAADTGSIRVVVLYS
tara:strand:- start:193 stop:783 length:591 start_codon:yes stop_codon:yes gene_type:complete